MPEAQPGLAAYLVCSTQWNVGGMGGRTGLRYADCIATLSAYLPQWQADQPDVWAQHSVPALMQDIQIIEAALLAAWGEKSDADAATRKAHGPHH